MWKPLRWADVRALIRAELLIPDDPIGRAASRSPGGATRRFPIERQAQGLGDWLEQNHLCRPVDFAAATVAFFIWGSFVDRRRIAKCHHQLSSASSSRVRGLYRPMTGLVALPSRGSVDGRYARFRLRTPSCARFARPRAHERGRWCREWMTRGIPRAVSYLLRSGSRVRGQRSARFGLPDAYIGLRIGPSGRQIRAAGKPLRR